MSLTRWRETGEEFDFDGYRVFTRHAGSGDEALLLLHGFPTSSWDFEAMWPALARRFPHVMTADLPGFGFSERPAGRPRTIGEQADLIEALLASRGVRRVHLLTHDRGAFVALELLARSRSDAGNGGGERARILSGVVLSAALFPEACHPRLSQRLLLGSLGPLYLRLAGARGFGRSFSALFGPDTQPGMIELHDYWTLVYRAGGRRRLRALPRFVDERRLQRSRWLPALLDADLPLRFICGGADALAGPAMAARFRERIADADVVVLDGIGHYPHVEAPDRCLRAVLAFHDAQPAPAG